MMKYLLLTLLVSCFLNSCMPQGAAYTQPFEGYVRTENPPVYTAKTLGKTPTGLVLHRNDKVLVVKRREPNWFVFSKQGQEYYIAYDYISTSPN